MVAGIEAGDPPNSGARDPAQNEAVPEQLLHRVTDKVLSSHASANALIIVLIILTALSFTGIGLFATHRIGAVEAVTVAIAPQAEASQLLTPQSMILPPG